MLKIGLRRRSATEAVGQTICIALGALCVTVGVVPAGIAGGNSVRMFTRLPSEPLAQGKGEGKPATQLAPAARPVTENNSGQRPFDFDAANSDEAVEAA